MHTSNLEFGAGLPLHPEIRLRSCPYQRCRKGYHKLFAGDATQYTDSRTTRPRADETWEAIFLIPLLIECRGVRQSAIPFLSSLIQTRKGTLSLRHPSFPLAACEEERTPK